MTTKQFTEYIFKHRQDLNIWAVAAEIAIKEINFDLYVQHWIDQYNDPGSRGSVIRMLGKEMTNELVKIINHTNT